MMLLYNNEGVENIYHKLLVKLATIPLTAHGLPGLYIMREGL